ncbi:MAG: triose-phosphate isomerase [Bacteroidota bacterium]
MSQRKHIVAGNWKMNKDYDGGRALAQAVVDQLQATDTHVIFGTPFIHLKSVSKIVSGINNVHLAAQNVHQADSGAYTGEISAAMLRSVGCDFVILGHSERRAYFGEAGQLIADKVKQALKHELGPIYCCGEELDVREAGRQEEVVKAQIESELFHLSAEEFGQVVIAYEPVWAIGTGKTASPEQAQDMHAFIRQLIQDKYGADTANATTILYGGSVKPANAKDIFSKPDVDGGLIGGASLKANDFNAIIQSF